MTTSFCSKKFACGASPFCPAQPPVPACNPKLVGVARRAPTRAGWSDVPRGTCWVLLHHPSMSAVLRPWVPDGLVGPWDVLKMPRCK